MKLTQTPGEEEIELISSDDVFLCVNVQEKYAKWLWINLLLESSREMSKNKI